MEAMQNLVNKRFSVTVLKPGPNTERYVATARKMYPMASGFTATGSSLENAVENLDAMIHESEKSGVQI